MKNYKAAKKLYEQGHSLAQCAEAIGGSQERVRVHLKRMGVKIRPGGFQRQGLITEGGKTCSKCGEFKEYKFFHHDKSASDGYKAYCRDCRYVPAVRKAKNICPFESGAITHNGFAGWDPICCPVR